MIDFLLASLSFMAIVGLNYMVYYYKLGDFFVFLIILPILLFAKILPRAHKLLSRIFQPELLMCSVWLISLDAFLFTLMIPNGEDEATFFETVAQSRMFDWPTPYWLVLIAVSICLWSIIARTNKQRRG